MVRFQLKLTILRWMTMVFVVLIMLDHFRGTYRDSNPRPLFLKLFQKRKLLLLYLLPVCWYLKEIVCRYLTKEHLFLEGLMSERANRPQEAAFSEHRLLK